MLKLYYTTTKGQDEIQARFNKSLGGYKSSSLVKNDEFDNFFGEISNYTISQNNESNYIGLILKNEGAAKTGILFHFTHPVNCYSRLSIAATDLSADIDGVQYMENIPNINSSPVYAMFSEAEGVDNTVSLGDLAPNEMIGIWFKREILVEVAKADYTNIIETDPENEHLVVEKTKTKSDTIDLVFSYD